MAKNILPDYEGRRRFQNRLVFIGIPLLVVIVGWGAWHALRGPGVLTANEHIERGMAEWRENDLRGALIELMNAVEQEPDNIEARLALGRLHMEAGNATAAEREIMRARELGAPESAWTEPLADAWLAQHKYDRVLKEIKVSDTSDRKLYAEVIAAHGGAFLGKGVLAVAIERFETALRSDPENVRALLGIAGIKLSTEDLDDARAYLDRARAAAPGRPILKRLEAEIEYAAGNYPEAVRAYTTLLQQVPSFPGAIYGLARAQIAAGQNSEAVGLLDETLKREPKDLMGRFLRSIAAYRRKDYESAYDDAELVLNTSPGHLPSLLLAAGSAFALDRLPQAKIRLEQLLAARPDDPAARRLLGATYLRLGEGDKANAVLQSLSEMQASDSTLLALLGGAALDSGDLTRAERYLAQATAADPENSLLLTELGAVRVRLGNVQQGVDDLERAWTLEAVSRNKAVVALVQTHLATGDVTRANEVIERLRREDAEDALPDILAGFVHLHQRNLTDARSAFRQALRKEPDAPDAIANAASMEVLLGDLDAAIGVLREGVGVTGGDPRLVQQLAAVEARNGDVDAAIRRLVVLNDENPGLLQSKILLARTYLEAGRDDEAAGVAARALSLAPDSPLAIGVAGDVDIALGNFESAAKRFTALVSRFPNDPLSHIRLAQAHGALGRLDLAEIHLAKSLDLRSGYRPAVEMLARVQIQRRRFTHARETIGSLAAADENDPQVLELRTSLAVAEGRLADAVNLYERIIEAAPSEDNIVRLAALQHAIGQRETAEETLQAWLRDRPTDVKVLTAIADLAAAGERWEEATDRYQAVLAVEPDNAAAHNNIAYSLWKSGRMLEALPHAERAISLDPANPNVLDTVGLVYVATGRLADGVALLEQAVQLHPQDPTYRYHLAWARSRLGERAAARAILDAMLAEGTDFPERAEAQALLDELSR